MRRVTLTFGALCIFGAGLAAGCGTAHPKKAGTPTVLTVSGRTTTLVYLTRTVLTFTPKTATLYEQP
jgi:hypothetical protein